MRGATRRKTAGFLVAGVGGRIVMGVVAGLGVPSIMVVFLGT